MAKFEKAHAEWPKTTVTKDGGVHVTGKYVGPMLNNNTGVVVTILGAAGAIYAWVAVGDVRAAMWTVVFLFAAYAVFLREAIYAIFGKRVDVKIYPDRIALPSWLGYKNYSRDMPIEFRIERHQQALTEKGNAVIFRNAIEAVMQYGEKRIQLAEMPETSTELARALVIRLQNVCHSVDAAMQTASGSKQGAPRAEDFGPAPDIR
jgi:hypothetical protein